MVMKIFISIVSGYYIVAGVRYTFYTKAVYERHNKENKKNFIKWDKGYRSKGYIYFVFRIAGVFFILIGLGALILLFFNSNGRAFSSK
jgi:hypothetical protein